MRKAFYNIGVAFREEDVQRNGAVCIIFLNVRDLELSGKILELAYKVTLVNQASAMWMSAYHICYSDEAWKIHEALSKSALSKPQQVRTRVHHGKSLRRPAFEVVPRLTLMPAFAATLYHRVCTGMPREIAGFWNRSILHTHQCRM